jgi:hypothetical protein
VGLKVYVKGIGIRTRGSWFRVKSLGFRVSEFRG